jgi:hypothetical protein
VLIPVIGQFQRGRAVLFGLVQIIGRRQKNQGKPALLVIDAADFGHAHFIAIEIERVLDIADTHHRMQIFHHSYSRHSTWLMRQSGLVRATLQVLYSRRRDLAG